MLRRLLALVVMLAIPVAALPCQMPRFFHKRARIPCELIPVAVVPSAAPRLPEPKQIDWPMFGGTSSRNMINFTARDILDNFDPEKGDGILWKAELGSRSYTQPVVAGGKIFIGTNNENPRNQRDTEKNRIGEVEPLDRDILMCFEERTGKFLWQAVHNKLPAGPVSDWPKEGSCSTPVVEGERVYYVSGRCTVVCADVNGMANGMQGRPLQFTERGKRTIEYNDATDADILWEYDMRKELNVFPHDKAASSPLIVGNALFVVTGNGVDANHLNVTNPDAPSFIALDKRTGKLLWADSSPGKNIMHGQWSSPSFAAEPVLMVIFPGGDGWLRAFDPPTGKLLWKFDGNPKKAVHELGGLGTKNDFLACPVVSNGRVYIGLGQDPEHSTGTSHLWCIDLKRAVEFGKTNKDADVSPVNDNFDPNAAVNKRSALAWHFGGPDKRPWMPRDFLFGRTMSNVCVVGDVAYCAELHGYLHCLDARTGTHHWMYDTKSSIWGSPYYADGKVFLGSDQGSVFIFRHKEKPEEFPNPGPALAAAPNAKAARKVLRELHQEIEKKVLLRKIEFDAALRTTPTVANGVLYVNTEKTLYAIGKR
jgi:outer membrane protein assembly factor BamB